MSPTNSTRTGQVSPAGKKSTTPPRTQNSPCWSTGSSWAEAGVGEQLAEGGRRREASGHELLRRGQQALRGADARQQRGGGADDQPRGPLRQGGQRPGPRGRHVQMRRDGAVGIDFRRREREHGARQLPLGNPEQRAAEEPRVRRHLLHAGVGRHDEDDRGGCRRGGGGERLRRRRQAGDERRRAPETGTAGGGLEDRAQRE